MENSLVVCGFLATPGVIVGLKVLAHQRLTENVPVSVNGNVPWLASSFEQRTFRRLEKRFPPHQFVISAHVLLIDVIGRGNLSLLSQEERRFAWRAHCDFIITDRQTLSVLEVIEVNGPSHHQPVQRDRDWKKRHLLDLFGIPLEVVR